MKLFSTAVIGLGFLATIGSVQAGVIFSDDFETVTGSGNAVAQGDSLLNWDGGDNWDVSDGTVDLVNGTDNPWGIECHNSSNFCVDLDGTSRNAGELTSINVGPLDAGNYTLSFWVSGNQRSGGDFTVAAILADTWQELAAETFSLAADADWEKHVLSFTLASTRNPIHISFKNRGGDNVGMMLDDVSLVPAPATLALFGLGLLGLGAVRRRKTTG